MTAKRINKLIGKPLESGDPGADYWEIAG